MKRISLALAIVVSVFVATATTQAAIPRPHSSSIVGLVRHVAQLGHATTVVHRLAHHDLTPLSVTHSATHQTAQTLALAASAFAPAVINSQFNYSESASDADGNWFSSNHTPNSAGQYESFGFVFGWYQRADWNATNPVTSFRYQGANMGSAANAQRAYSDGDNYTKQGSGQAGQSCTNNASVLNCDSFIYSFSDNNGTNWTEEYVVMQHNACLGEIAGDVPTANASTVATQFDSTMSNIVKAAATALSNTCGSSGGTNPTAIPTSIPQPTAQPTAQPTTPAGKTQFSVITVRFEKFGAKPDWNLKKNPLTQAKVGSKVQLAIYFNVQSLASSSVTMNRHYVLKRNGKKILDESTSGDITDVDTYRYSVPKSGGINLSKPGIYSVTISATMAGKTDSASSQLQALKKYVAPKRVSFSITKLQLTNGTIHVGQQANVSIAFNVKNLKGHINGIIARTVLAQINGSWKGVSTNSSSTLVVNGNNTASVTTQLNAPGTFQIQVTITVGASSQSKRVSVTVIR